MLCLQSLITLLGCEGDPKIRDKDGRTVAHVAAESEAVGCLHVLIEACTLLIMEVYTDESSGGIATNFQNLAARFLKALLKMLLPNLRSKFNSTSILKILKPY